MFNFIFTFLTALQQSVLLVIGLFIFGIGGIILLAGLQARRGLRVTATIIGVRERGGLYYPVYSFVLPTTGDEKQITSRSGSNIRRGKETGRVVELYVDSENPEKISGAGPWFVLGAALFLAPGAGMMYYSLATHPLDRTTLLTLLLAASYLGWKAHKIILPKDKRLTREGWLSQNTSAQNLDATPVTPIEDLRPPQLSPAQARQQRTTMRFAAPLFFLIGLGMLGGGCYLGQKLDALLKDGIRVPGQVVDLEESRDSDGSTYHAIVDFEDAAHERHRFRDKVGTYPASHVVGDAVTVLYAKDDPDKSAMIDRGWLNWLPAGALALFGPLFMLAGISQWSKLSRDDGSA